MVASRLSAPFSFNSPKQKKPVAPRTSTSSRREATWPADFPMAGSRAPTARPLTANQAVHADPERDGHSIRSADLDLAAACLFRSRRRWARDQIGPAPAEQIPGLTAQELFGGRVGKGDVPVIVFDDNAVAHQPKDLVQVRSRIYGHSSLPASRSYGAQVGIASVITGMVGLCPLPLPLVESQR